MSSSASASPSTRPRRHPSSSTVTEIDFLDAEGPDMDREAPARIGRVILRVLLAVLGAYLLALLGGLLGNALA